MSRKVESDNLSGLTPTRSLDRAAVLPLNILSKQLLYAGHLDPKRLKFV